MSQLTSIALRNVTRNKRRSLITLLAIFIGVAIVVILKGFTNGFVEMSIGSVVQGKTGALSDEADGRLKPRSNVEELSATDFSRSRDAVAHQAGKS